MAQFSLNTSDPPSNETHQYTGLDEVNQYHLYEGTSQLSNNTLDPIYAPAASTLQLTKQTDDQQLLQTEVDKQLTMETESQQTSLETPDKQITIEPEELQLFLAEANGQLVMNLGEQLTDPTKEPSFFQEWRSRGYFIRASKGKYYVWDGRDYVGTLNSGGDLILKNPRRSDNSVESPSDDKIVRKWRKLGYSIQIINGKYYVCDGRIFKGVLGADGEIIGEDLPVKEPLPDILVRQETLESLLDENIHRYIQEWRTRGYRVQVLHGRCYVYDAGLYIGTIGEVGELLVKASRNDDNEKHLEKAEKLVGKAIVQKWAARDCEIKVFNDKCYVCQNLVLTGILGDGGEISVEFPSGISRHESLQRIVWRRLYAIRPAVTSLSNIEIREVGFTISAMHFLGPEWIETYGNNSFEVFQRVILEISKFSFLADIPLPEKEYTFGQLTTSRCTLGSIIKMKSGCTLEELYILMGSINLVYMHGKATLSWITDQQWDFCGQYDIPLHGVIGRIWE